MKNPYTDPADQRDASYARAATMALAAVMAVLAAPVFLPVSPSPQDDVPVRVAAVPVQGAAAPSNGRHAEGMVRAPTESPERGWSSEKERGSAQPKSADTSPGQRARALGDALAYAPSLIGLSLARPGQGGLPGGRPSSSDMARSDVDSGGPAGPRQREIRGEEVTSTRPHGATPTINLDYDDQLLLGLARHGWGSLGGISSNKTWIEVTETTAGSWEPAPFYSPELAPFQLLIAGTGASPSPLTGPRKILGPGSTFCFRPTKRMVELLLHEQAQALAKAGIRADTVDMTAGPLRLTETGPMYLVEEAFLRSGSRILLQEAKAATSD